MSEPISIDKNLSKKERYSALVRQLILLSEGESDFTAKLCNTLSVLKYELNFFWVGVYRNIENELILGPFQGTLACTRIASGRGVCGHVLKTKKAIIVPNVNEFPGHIACSTVTQSEIVIPIFNKRGEIEMVLDIDSSQLDDFDQQDLEGLTEITTLISSWL